MENGLSVEIILRTLERKEKKKKNVGGYPSQHLCWAGDPQHVGKEVEVETRSHGTCIHSRFAPEVNEKERPHVF